MQRNGNFKGSHLVFEVVYVDVLGKRLVELVPKGAFAPLFAERGACGSRL